MKDDEGIAQIWTVSPNGGPPSQLTRNRWPIASAFTWSPNGRWVAHAMDNCVCVTDTRTGDTTQLTKRSSDATAPLAEACVFSPDGKRVACMRRMPDRTGESNQIFVVTLPDGLR
jgi:Tol biopolymer transport system component